MNRISLIRFFGWNKEKINGSEVQNDSKLIRSIRRNAKTLKREGIENADKMSRLRPDEKFQCVGVSSLRLYEKDWRLCGMDCFCVNVAVFNS